MSTAFVNNEQLSFLFIIVAFLQNATMEYSSESVCGCVCVCVCVCVSVFLHANPKNNRFSNMKSEYIVVYENISDKFDIGHCRTKVKFTARLLNFFPFTAIQSVRSHNSTLVQARKLILKCACLYDNNIQIV